MTHFSEDEDKALEFFRTPTHVTEALLDRVPFDGPILEPCCGDGAMAEVLRRRYVVFAYDVADRGYGKVKNFLQRTRPIPNVVTNPPFSLAPQIIEQALFVATRKVALLLSVDQLRWIKAGDGLRFVYLFRRRPKFSGTHFVNYSPKSELAWFIWVKGYVGKVELDWID